MTQDTNTNIEDMSDGQVAFLFLVAPAFVFVALCFVFNARMKTEVEELRRDIKRCTNEEHVMLLPEVDDMGMLKTTTFTITLKDCLKNL